MIKEWEVKVDGRQLEQGEIVSAVFDNRGIDDITSFLNPTDESLIDFENLHNIDKAFEIVDDGITMGNKFLVYADTDTDGCTAGAIMYRYLRNYTDNVEITINDGKKHGIADFDISVYNFDILIIVDSINENEVYDCLIKAGKKVVILDHHLIPDNFRDDIALVSSANDYPNSQLSGAGVTWKFCKYYDYMTLNDYADSLVDLAACGIVADMMDLSVDENRYICYQGFKNLNNLGIKKVLGSYQFNAQAVSFSIATLVNAANRMNKNKNSLMLFLSDDEDEIKSIVKTLKNAKDKQAEIVADIMPDLYEQMKQQIDNKVMILLVDTDASISGLIGNKMLEMCQRPVLILKETNNGFAGSGRGIGVDNFKEYVDNTGLAWTGGHENAFGVEISAENYDEFCNTIQQSLCGVQFKNKTAADVQIDLAQITSDLIRNLKTCNYVSGTGFKPITVMVDNITDYEVGSMSNGKHLKITANDIAIIKWNFGGDISEFDGRPISVIGALDSSFFGRKLTNQIIVNDIKVG